MAKLLKTTGLAVLKRPDGGVVTQRTANPLPKAENRHSSHNSPSVPCKAIRGTKLESAKPMQCTRCDKKLSRKTARLIEGKLLCSACLFPKTERGSYAPLA